MNIKQRFALTDLDAVYADIADTEAKLAALHAKARELEERGGKEWDKDEAYEKRKRELEERD